MIRILGPLAAALAALAPVCVLAQPLSPAEIAAVDAAAAKALADSPTPSLSVAVVRGGRLAFAKAYGLKRLDPPAPAEVDARYNIGSVSKQFTAAVVLRLADQGRLSLDDKAADHVARLSGADRITLRQALDHTAGYNSYFMLDFMPAEGERPVDPSQIARRWGAAPLDFAPGDRWAYSNTGYVVAGLVAQQASGRSLPALLDDEIFAPLGMTSAGAAYERPLGPADAVGYARIATASPRAAPTIGRGWEFAAGGLAMSASDLARWDMAMLEGRLLTPAAWTALATPARLNDGTLTDYGLGVYVDTARGRRRIRHDGLTSGFAAENRVYPDDGAAIVVLANADFGAAPRQVADAIEAILLPAGAAASAVAPPPAPAAAPAIDEAALATAKALRRQLADGTLDRTRLTPELSAHLDGAVLADYRASLRALGEPTAFVQLRHDEIGGLRASLYEVAWEKMKLIGVLRLAPDGTVASFALFEP
ncbi:serine hydrolase domain-containing protein [Caulobacter endophyticus]|uniref:serine hydrolase domain-containing protein n=1 Tax=Caulobacter endophyticus TaxID=2172652 RepID=UPI00240FF0F4|nr:serine hydrolase domain-containing protein [Caulobacter endophyticus]MDG2531945.1 serine hydrolase [Caulobacter endophyticus]